jgi:hypothetical protein
MYQLKLSDIELIRLDISRQRVTYSHLLDDLVDHVCCDVEAEMDGGLSFRQAYEKVRSKIGINRFKKIQEETLILIDKNYKSMKTFMKIFGVLSPSLMAVAALFKIQHWPGAGIMLVLGFFFLCFFFLPSAIYVLNAENQTDKKHLFMKLSGLISSVIFLLGILFRVMHWPGAGIALTVGLFMLGIIFMPALIFARISDDKGEGKRAAYLVGLFAGLFYMAGFLFKLMHWPGAGLIILVGLILFAAIFIPLFVFAHYKNESHVSGHFIFVIVASMMAILFEAFMALTVSKDVLSEFVAVEEQMDDVLDDLGERNNVFVRGMLNTSAGDELIATVHQKTGEIESWIEDLKRELVIATEPENEEAIAGGEIDFSEIKRKDAYDIQVKILIIEGKASQLSEKIREYKGYLLSASDDAELASKLGMLLDISEVRVDDDYEIPWENATFEHRTLVSNLNTLTIIQIELRLAEKEFLKSVSEKTGLSGQQIIAEETSLKQPGSHEK